MSDIALFDSGANVPAHIRAVFGGADNSDLSAGVSGGFPILSIKGKVWHMRQSGVDTLITGPDGEPRPSIEVVIIKANPAVSKLYYTGGYTEGSDERPTCASNDGIAPVSDALEPQAAKCAICPHNQWGSRITENGAKGKACADSRRLALSPSGELDNPMLLKVPAASLRDLQAYGDMLAKRGTPYQAIVTKIGFDHTVAHPKLTFKPMRWLEPGEVTLVAQTMKSSTIDQIMGPMSSIAADGPNALDEMAGAPPANLAEVGAPAPVAAKPKAAAKAKAVATVAEVEQALAPVKTDAFGGGAPAPAAPAAPKRDHSALLAEASQSLDDLLATIDD